jgi:hypothetical protein
LLVALTDASAVLTDGGTVMIPSDYENGVVEVGTQE